MKIIAIASIFALASQALPSGDSTSPDTCQPVNGKCKVTNWICLKGSTEVGNFKTWSNHTPRNAAAICQKKAGCKNGCTASTYSTWDCYKDSIFVGAARIWWGHTSGDAAWACNKWRSACGNHQGGCTAKMRSNTISMEAKPPRVASSIAPRPTPK